jgi:hypothetical protein
MIVLGGAVAASAATWGAVKAFERVTRRSNRRSPSVWTVADQRWLRSHQISPIAMEREVEPR